MRDQHDSARREQIIRRLQGDPLLSDFMVPLRLVEGEDVDIAATFGRLARSLPASERVGLIQFRVVDGHDERCWSLALTPEGCSPGRPSDDPDLEVITTSEVWKKVASGQLSPLEAFAGQGLRVRGSVALARSLVRGLRAT